MDSLFFFISSLPKPKSASQRTIAAPDPPFQTGMPPKATPAKRPKKKSKKRTKTKRSSTVSLVDRKPLRTILQAQKILEETFQPHALPGWKIDFTEHTYNRAGSCSHHTKTIRLNKSFARTVEHATLIDTILHEVAHMKAGEGANHGPAWKKIAKEIGCSGTVSHNFVWEKAAFVAKCPRGHYEQPANQIRWVDPLCCPRCRKWLLYFREGSGEPVEFGGSSALTKYHREFQAKEESKAKE
jgi:predicted SprT family Zn-dependent metalloprotease